MSATAKISQHIQQNPEDLNSSQSASAHLRQRSMQHHNLWGEWKVQMVPLTRRDDGTVDWALPNVSALLMWHYEHNLLFRKAMERAVKANPNMPLSLTTTCDEFTPGNVLHPEQRKILCVWYLSAKEFSRELSCEHLWIPIAGLLSKKCKLCQGLVLKPTGC